ncbi:MULTISPECIES: sensor histidine kinase [Intestinimonas]|jgi:signal transduction histidine kinase|uniref:histidine kinase n=1 Tax=Intestinimonas massiliensis (ex Afouda et al. 2020) TaxID=1673721 RepID=A0AAW5JMR5_9FIRM|nr:MULTISPECIES: HAMP domain-containing sensor histidine kinase [Intestinimonas]MBS6281405.1 HAMP domain-containing histidine kinase [Oscillospiraceae bacterium]MDU1326065.1 HAMP domain-containing sensor histidine kinase [Clostridiales bacterium]MCG4528638.1 HAMP domain-containing histidine kinase [Intestinimonas massiliensis (ex Afouda et al. 2020)]MCI5561809.1 HAMP domain-containing histidine kinase [Intestinimonas massiliensis (ex Afouda et al. 2020)]MCQ4769149.1 HAMP domain-containing hist
MRNPTERVPFWRSIQVKFALTYILIVAAVLSLLNTYPLLVSRDLVITSKETSLQSQAGFIAGALAVSETLTEEGVEQAMEDLGPMTFNRIMITGPTGLVLYDTEEVGNARGHYALLWEITTALRDTGNDVFRCEYRDGAFRSWAVAPVVYRNMVIGAVYLHERDTEQASLLLGIQNNLRNISFMICAVALVMSVIVSGAITRRIAALLRAIRIVREGEYGHRVVIKGGDELSQLAGEFNELTGRLQTTEEVRRRFVSDASHELKTPLASIRLLTDSILQTGDMDPATVKDFVSDIGEEAERLTRISEKLLTLTRMDSAVAVAEVPVDVKRVVEKVEHMLTPLADEGEVTVETDLQEDCMVLATEDDLYQIAFNLMENAVKYNLPGGSVTVTLRGAGDLVTLTVEDTGVGIPEEDLGKVFDRFYRVDKARSRAAGGTGLGLSIVRDTVRQHGGAVTVRRRESEGTCFEVAFPRWYGEEKGGAL